MSFASGPIKLRADTYLAPTEAFHVADIALPSGRLPAAHTHDFPEVFWVTQGQVRHRCNGRENVLPEGSVTFIRPSDCHSLRATSGGARLLNLMFRAADLDGLGARARPTADRGFFWSDAPMPEVWQLSEHQSWVLTSLLAALPARSVAARDSWILALLEMLRAAPAPIAALPPWLATLLMRAEAPDVLQTGVPALVALSGRSHAHLCRALQAHLGLTPSLLLAQYRIKRAKRLLSTTDRKIEDIAQDCGFTHRSHMARLFKTNTGQSPRTWRRAMRVNPVILP